MKNIITILKEAGLTLTDEQEQAINKAAAENYRTIADYQKVQAARDGLQTQLDGVKADLAKFDGVDLDGLKKQITDAQRKAADAEAAYTKQLADRLQRRSQELHSRSQVFQQIGGTGIFCRTERQKAETRRWQTPGGGGLRHRVQEGGCRRICH